MLVLLLILGATLMSLCATSINPQRSFGWTLNFMIAISMIWIPLNDLSQTWNLTFRTARLLIYVFTPIGLLEFATKDSLFFGHFGLPGFLNTLWNTDRSWSIYRLTTTLGHPLNNGFFFCTMALLMLTYSYRRQTVRACALPIGLALILLLLTGSRNSMIAFVVGVILIALTKSQQQQSVNFERIRNISFLLLMSALVSQPILTYISRRSVSKEGSSSFSYRFRLLAVIQDALPSVPAKGFGPGTSSEAFAGLGQRTILENGVAQLCLSLGLYLTATMLLASLFLVLLVLKRDLASFVLTLPLIILFLTTNFADDNFPFVAFIGLMIAVTRLSLHQSGRQENQSTESTNAKTIDKSAQIATSAATRASTRAVGHFD
jgi:hypothetical protein